MSKECWQLTNLAEPTSCFKDLKGPCLEDDCLVERRIQELTDMGIEVDDGWRLILPHSACRKSYLSPYYREHK